jgi:restriction system protein
MSISLILISLTVIISIICYFRNNTKRDASEQSLVSEFSVEKERTGVTNLYNYKEEEPVYKFTEDKASSTAPKSYESPVPEFSIEKAREEIAKLYNFKEEPVNLVNEDMDSYAIQLVNESIIKHKVYIDKFVLIAEPKVFVIDKYGDEVEDKDALEEEVDILLNKLLGEEITLANCNAKWIEDPAYPLQVIINNKNRIKGEEVECGLIDLPRFWFKDYLKRHLRNIHEYNFHNTIPSLLPNFSKMSGTEFEQYLAKFLELHEYIVILNGKTGDQGGDLIIEKNGKKVVVQAKCYVGTVGNKAVQEVVSATKFYSCNEGWVVTNANFTKSAEELAKKCNVTLIDGSQLRRLEEYL